MNEMLWMANDVVFDYLYVLDLPSYAVATGDGWGAHHWVKEVQIVSTDFRRLVVRMHRCEKRAGDSYGLVCCVAPPFRIPPFP